MAKSPLTVVWVDGDNGYASPRWAAGHTPSEPYPDASLSVLGTAKNATDWKIHALCHGCSTWSSSSSTNGANKIGFATRMTTPTTPSSNTSSVGIHSEKRRRVACLQHSSSSTSSASVPPAAPTAPLNYPTTIIRPSQNRPGNTPSSVVTQPPQTTIDVTYAPTIIHESTRQSTGVTVTVTVTAASRPFQPTPVLTPCNRFSGFGGGRFCTTPPYGGDPYGGNTFGGGPGGGCGGGGEYGEGGDHGDGDDGPFGGGASDGFGGRGYGGDLAGGEDDSGDGDGSDNDN